MGYRHGLAVLLLVILLAVKADMEVLILRGGAMLTKVETGNSEGEAVLGDLEAQAVPLFLVPVVAELLIMPTVLAERTALIQ